MTWPGFWQKNTLRTRALGALVPIYQGLARYHRRRELSRREPLPVPVVLVGNIVVGGTGKTPFILWLVEELRRLGLHPGVISRGYGRASRGVKFAGPDVSPKDIGDEPCQIYRRTGVPVAVGDDRLIAAKALLKAQPDISVIISDDGLQHRRLPRDCVFCLFDGEAGIGNGQLLPAGPLREGLAVVSECNRVIFKGRRPESPFFPSGTPDSVMMLSLSEPQHVDTGAAWESGRQLNEPVVAVCGIGQPASFFALLRAAGWEIEPLALPDHGALSSAGLRRLRDCTVFMTRKDAVKLPADHGLRDAWILDLEVTFSPADRQAICDDLAQQLPGIQTDRGET